MKKFKIIERSRFLSDSELPRIKGKGYVDWINTCTPEQPYSSRYCPPHESCGPAVLNFMSCGSALFNSCGTAVNYRYSGGTCLAHFNISCGVGYLYNLL